MSRAVETQCGIASNSLGVTPAPPGISELGEAVWRWDKPSAERGLVVLGTLIGHSDIVAAKRMQEERKLLQQLPEPPDQRLMPTSHAKSDMTCSIIQAWRNDYDA